MSRRPRSQQMAGQHMAGIPGDNLETDLTHEIGCLVAASWMMVEQTR